MTKLTVSPECMRGYAMLDELLALAASKGAAGAQASDGYAFLRRTITLSWLWHALEATAKREGFVAIEGFEDKKATLWYIRSGVPGQKADYDGTATEPRELVRGLARNVLGQVADVEPTPRADKPVAQAVMA